VYQTTEAEILQEFAPATGEISRDEGLQLVPVLRQARKAGFFPLQSVALAVLEAKLAEPC